MIMHLKLLATEMFIQKLVQDDNKGNKAHYWPFMRGIHRSPVDSSHKGLVIWERSHVVTSACVCSGRLWQRSMSKWGIVYRDSRKWHVRLQLYAGMVGAKLWRRLVSLNCNDVIMGAMASQITNLPIVYSTVYSGTKENINARRHWPLWGEFTCDRWIPRTKGR